MCNCASQLYLLFWHTIYILYNIHYNNPTCYGGEKNRPFQKLLVKTPPGGTIAHCKCPFALSSVSHGTIFLALTGMLISAYRIVKKTRSTKKVIFILFCYFMNNISISLTVK